MLKHKDHFHGSDLEKIEKIYGISKEDIVSFSANVNPLGISGKLRRSLSEQLDAITRYPDREYRELKEAIAAYVGSTPDSVIVGGGSTELISLFIRTQSPKKAMILGPTYSEYEREIQLSGGQTIYYPLSEEADFEINVTDLRNRLTDDLDLLVLCNPNNPTSTAIRRKELRKILDSCLIHGIFVMVDETYVEFAEDIAEISAVPLTRYYNNLILLRGTSKFFAAPGLRLGYAVTGNRDLIRTITALQNPWSISSLAEIAGRLMFSDTEYIRATRDLIRSERSRIYQKLSAMPSLKVYRPTANFMLCRILREDVTAEDVFEHCIRQGLMIRNCSTFPFLDSSYIRFCFMKPEQNDLLLEKMSEIL